MDGLTVNFHCTSESITRYVVVPTISYTDSQHTVWIVRVYIRVKDGETIHIQVLVHGGITTSVVQHLIVNNILHLSEVVINLRELITGGNLCQDNVSHS
ncbi:hypothetical protein D3C87_1550800 [compost metagenome]